jgi:hypothetical protein
LPPAAAGYAEIVKPGDVIIDRYRLDEPVASGGMAHVWSATDLVLARSVAIKLIAPSLRAEPGFAQRFQAEARTLASLRHPGIVDIYDYGQATLPDGEVAYLVMELVGGVPLSERLAREGRLGADETMSIVAYAADALEAAHAAGVVHRDVKPGNLLLRPDGTVTVVDFGVAVAAGVTRLTRPDEVLGTALYMAPEQVSKQDTSAHIDVYALGVVAYECLAGAPPFTGDTALAVAMRHVEEDAPPLPSDVPAAARAVVARAMAKDPERRFPSAAALAAAARAAGAAPTEIIAVPPGLDEATAGRPAVRPAGPPPAAGQAPPRPRRRAWWVVAAAVVVAVAAAIAILLALDDGTRPTDKVRPPAATGSQPGAGASEPTKAGAGPGSGTPARSAEQSPSRAPESSATRTAGPVQTTGGGASATTSPAPASPAPASPAPATSAAPPASAPEAQSSAAEPTP